MTHQVPHFVDINKSYKAFMRINFVKEINLIFKIQFKIYFQE